MARSKTKSKKNIAHREYLPWIEKYRPRKMSDIAHQSHVVSTLRNSVKGKGSDLPHLLFYGPPGSGKTSTILALCFEIYGPNVMKSRVLELNASDERGINVVRNKIKNFAQYTVNSKAKDKAFKCPPFKIIILDEADSMTRDAQTALRRTMEKYSNVTRFCLICNYVSRIIAPVASRCSKFRFEPLSNTSMKTKLSEIAKMESIRIEDDTENEIIRMSQGDMRKSITLLQSASLMKSEHETVTLQDVHTVAVRIPHHIIKDNLIQSTLKNSFNAIHDAAHYVISEGYPVSFILPELMQFVMFNDALFTNLAKSRIALKIAAADKKLVDGASELLQLMDVLGEIAKHITKQNDSNDLS